MGAHFEKRGKVPGGIGGIFLSRLLVSAKTRDSRAGGARTRAESVTDSERRQRIKCGKGVSRG
jgi:hypothetical protein